MIRPATPADAARVVSGFEWLFAPPGGRPPGWDEERAAAAVVRVIASDRGTVLVADDAGEIVGFCSVYIDVDSIRFGQRAWVEDLAVAATHRSRGVGKRLLDEAKDWARERGATHLELDSGEARVDAHRFYERERPSWRSVSFGWLL